MARYVNRSARTGRFVSSKAAARSPRTTVTQNVPSKATGSNRSAVTGRYVSNATATRHPNTTISEGK